MSGPSALAMLKAHLKNPEPPREGLTELTKAPLRQFWQRPSTSYRKFSLPLLDASTQVARSWLATDDERRHCADCRNCYNGRCQITDLQVIDFIPRRCDDFRDREGE